MHIIRRSNMWIFVQQCLQQLVWILSSNSNRLSDMWAKGEGMGSWKFVVCTLSGLIYNCCNIVKCTSGKKDTFTLIPVPLTHCTSKSRRFFSGKNFHWHLKVFLIFFWCTVRKNSKHDRLENPLFLQVLL